MTFSNSITFTVTCEYHKDTDVEIESVSLPVSHVACRWSSQAGLFRCLTTHVFGGSVFQKLINYESDLFSKMWKILCRLDKTTQKFRKTFSFLRQMYLNCLHLIVSTKKRILVIDSQCVNKKS